MAKWSEMNATTRTAVGLVVLALVGGGYVWQSMQPGAVTGEPAAAVDLPKAGAVEPEVEPGAAAVIAPVPDVVAAPAAGVIAPTAGVIAPVPEVVAVPVAEPPPAAAACAAADVGVAEAAAPMPVDASLDLVRIEQDGSAVVAGRAPAGAAVALLANRVPVASATADQAGKFVAMFVMPVTASGQMLTMEVTLPDGSKIAPGSQVAIATIMGPKTVVVEGTAGAATGPAALSTAADPAATGTMTALALTETGVKVVQGGAEPLAEVAQIVSLDVIAYPSPDRVQFGGRGVAGQFIRLYLDNVAFGDALTIAPDGTWSVTIKGIAPGLYTLRADQVDGTGKVIARFETPFKRETPEALAAASGVVAPDVQLADAGTADAAGKSEALEPANSDPMVAKTDTATADAPATTAAVVADATAPEAAAEAAQPVADAAVEAANGTVAAPGADPAAAVATVDTAAVTAVQPSAEAAVDAALPVAQDMVAPTVPAPDGAVATTAKAPVATEAPLADGAATGQAPPAPLTVTVQPGYTLWSIAQQNFGKGVLYVQVFEANRDKIKDPDLIYPGQVFTIPAN